MAVLQMQRINVCALKENRKAILERLQEFGAMEIDIRLGDGAGFNCRAAPLKLIRAIPDMATANPRKKPGCSRSS